MQIYKFRSESAAAVALTVDITGRNLPEGQVWAWVGEVQAEATGLGLSPAEIRRRLASDGLLIWP